MSKPTRRIAAVLLGAFVLLAASGCVSRQVEGSASVYTYETWVGPLIVLGGLTATAVGYFACTHNKRLGYGLLLGMPVVVLLAAPNKFLDSVKVDDDHFEVHGGWWWQPTAQSVRFSEVKEMEFGDEVGGFGHGPNVSFSLDCVLKSGASVRVYFDALGEEAIAEILERAEARGVSVPSLEDGENEEK